MNYRKICADGATRVGMCPEALQLRMVPIASCLPTQYSPRQECFPPQRNQALRIKVLRMDGPESHVSQWCLTDEVERRGASPASNEGTLSQSSTSSLAQRRRAPRSLEPIVRRPATSYCPPKCIRQRPAAPRNS